MSFQMNMFSMQPLKGALAMLLNTLTISVQLDPASSEDFVLPGEYLKIVDVAGPQIVVDKAGADEVAFGTVIYVPKKEKFYPGDTLEMAGAGSIQWMEAGAAIARGAQLESASGVKVIENAGNPICGFALDKATASGQLVRVFIINPYTLQADISSGSITGIPASITNLTLTGVADLSGGTIAGATPLVFEGATADAFETSLAITDPTADRTVTIPDADGNIDLLNQTALVITPGATPSWTPGASKALSTLTPGEDETIAAVTTGAVKGKVYYIEVVTSGVTSRTLTFGSNFKSTGTLATGTVSGKTFVLGFMFDGTNFVEVSRTTAM